MNPRDSRPHSLLLIKSIAYQVYCHSMANYRKYRMSIPDFSANRRAMIDSQLRTSGISQPWVVAAMGASAREDFVPAAMRSVAYMDRSIDLGSGKRWLNPPIAAAMMMEAGDVSRSDHVLVIGAGSGYLASLIASRAASVVAVEDDPALFALAETKLSVLGNVTVLNNPMPGGAAEHGPYSLIIIDGAVAELPSALTDQLADGGRIVCGLTQKGVTRLAVGYHQGRVAGQATALRPFADTEIAPLPGFAKKAEFVF